jgi:hypothetical protein
MEPRRLDRAGSAGPLLCHQLTSPAPPRLGSGRNVRTVLSACRATRRRRQRPR